MVERAYRAKERASVVVVVGSAGREVGEGGSRDVGASCAYHRSYRRKPVDARRTKYDTREEQEEAGEGVAG